MVRHLLVFTSRNSARAPANLPILPLREFSRLFFQHAFPLSGATRAEDSKRASR